MAELAAAQERTHYPIGERLLTRIRYGNEAFDWHSDTIPCHDCAAIKGQLHTPGCDVEECPNCHEQALSCRLTPVSRFYREAEPLGSARVVGADVVENDLQIN